MIDTQAPRVPLTVQLPEALIEELHTLAREKNVSVDEVVMEACLASVIQQRAPPYLWERDDAE
jgi:hypothetical protein